ncbi:MAG: hypothetical protein WBL93_14045 [Lutisporaceae bacterium]
MDRKDIFDVLLGKTSFDDEQDINYRAFISCLADIILNKYENKDIDKDLIEE